MEWADGKTRCRWANPKNEAYIQYHDNEWGVPVYDDHELFEMLVLESFQAGLSWECVLNKREAFREAFDGFDLEKVCAYGEEDFRRLRENPGIIRNKRKIQAASDNAKVFREIQKEFGSFSDYIWHWTDGQVVYEKGLTCSALSDRVSEDLKKRGMKFVGTTIIYSYLQAVGVIYSHEEGCFLEEGKALHYYTMEEKSMKDYATGIQHIGIPTKDMEASKAFYEKLGFEIAFETVNDGNQVKFFKLGNLVMEVYESEEVTMKVGAIDHVAIDVKDIEKTYEEICALGLNTLQDEIHFLPFWDNGVKFFTIKGPNEEKVEFGQML